MSAKAEVLLGSKTLESCFPQVVAPPTQFSRGSSRWNPEKFAHEQVLGLVRRVFLANGSPVAKQVVFSAAESQISASQIDVGSICEQVAWGLSCETPSHIALVEWEDKTAEKPSLCSQPRNPSSIKSRSTQLSANLWRVQRNCLAQDGPAPRTNRLACLAELRDQFEFTVITGPAAGVSSEAALLAQVTDGLILVIGAQTTRRATAKQIKRTLQASESRILGTVLCDRTFPIPQGIYSRL